MSHIGPAGQTPLRWFTNATQRWQNPSLKLLRLTIRRPASLPSTVAWRIWWPQGSLLQVGRSCRGPPWKLQHLWMKNRISLGWGGKQSRHVQWSRSDPDIALLKSQGGPLASAPFVSFPTSRATRLEPQVFKVLFLRRLRLPLPLSSRLPVRPSSRHLWPPPVCVCCGWSSRAQRVSSGNCSGKNLP